MPINKPIINEILQNLSSQKLIAATKYVGVDELKQLCEVNVSCFGENKVQDFLKKYELTKDLAVEWHFIGTLQVNKVKYIIDKVALIHSVDSLKLLEEINKQAKKFDLYMPVLLQVNISCEKTKHGFKNFEIESILQKAESFTNIKVIGLMTMAPNGNLEVASNVFYQLKQLQLKLIDQYPNLKELSMGMSNDYKEALSQGSTMIRLGSILFK